MKQTAEHVTSLLKVLSHQDRLMTLCHLTQGEMSAGQLAEAIGKKAPAMSQQLAVLRREGIINVRRDGQSLYYRIADSDVVAIMGFLYERFCGDGSQSDGEKVPLVGQGELV